MSKNKVVGLEISTHHIRAAEVENFNKKNPVVKRYFEVPIMSNVAKDGEIIDVDLAVEALKNLWNIGKFSTKRVVLGIGNQRVLVRNKRIADMSLENLKTSLPFLVGDELPLAVDDSILDFYPISEDKENREINGLLIAGVKDIIDTNIRALEKAKLYPIGVDLIPFGLTRALLEPNDGESSTVILNIGSKSTHITITQNNIPIFVRFIPAGSDDIVESIQKITSFEYDKALEVVNTLGVNSQAKDEQTQILSNTINEQVSSIYTSIRNTIVHVQEQYPENRLRNIILVGSGSKIPNLAESFTRALGLPIELGRAKVKFPKTMNDQDIINSSIAVGVALGDHRG